MDEFDLIAKYFRPLAKDFPGALNLQDDAAHLRIPAGHKLVVTNDAITEGVHFIGSEDASLIARRALRVNLSDLAAKGATPLCYFLALLLPGSTQEKWLAAFSQGLREDQLEFGIHLAGGDTTASKGPLAIAITALGLVPEHAMLKRGGAHPGDEIYISGRLGEAVVSNYTRLPEPRLALGASLLGVATACMDISDGLVQDLGHICAASGVSASIEAASVPHAGDLALALSGGDDYELLFTLPADRKAPEGCTKIGMIGVGSGVKVVDAAGKDITPERKGYRHFGG